MGFVELWASSQDGTEETSAVFGWRILGDSSDPELVQIRGAKEKVGWFRSRWVILLRTEGRRDISKVMDMDEANLAVFTGLLNADMGKVDELSGGICVAAALGDDILGVWRTNNAHAEVILDRIAASELDPSEDLLRCLRDIPSNSERLATINLAAAKAKAGAGRVPTESERLERMTPVLVQEGVRRAAVKLNDLGHEEEAQILFDRFFESVAEALDRRIEEFGE